MSIERAEQLKRELTDKYVVVAEGIPELRRFSGLTGTVKTVNMSGRALVQFDNPVDISWYDIDPSCLKVVDKPLPKKQAEPEKKHAEPAAKPPAAKAAPGKKSGKSPLELAREQAQGGTAAAPAGKKPSPLELARKQDAGAAGGAEAAPAAGKKLSPLELARMQDAGKQADAEPAPAAAEAPDETPAAEKPAATKPAGKKLSPLELARMQDKKQ